MKSRSVLILIIALVVAATIAWLLFKPAFSTGPVLATVGHEKIYLDDIKSEIEKIPQFQQTPPEQRLDRIRDYLNFKIETMMVLQLARRLKLDQKESYRQQLSMIRDKLIMDELAREKIFPLISMPAQADVERYFQSHLHEFDKGKVKIDYIALMDSSEAWTVYRELASGSDFRMHKKRTEQNPGSKPVALPDGMVAIADIPAEIGRELYHLKRSETTIPVKWMYHYYIVKILEREASSGTVKIVQYTELWVIDQGLNLAIHGVHV